jgi:heat shock protein HtpX
VRRKAVGRDFSLDLRIGTALVLVGAIYLGLFALFTLGFIKALDDSDAFPALGFLFLGTCVLAALVSHIREGGRLALRAAGARLLPSGERPELQELVARVAAQADIPAPAVALIVSNSTNAFAVGTTTANEVIALTTELTNRLTKEELEGVVAHEISHLVNRDGMVMTFVSGPAMAGSFFWHHDDHGARILAILGAPVFALGYLLMWTISRYREYVADRGSALLTGAPERLMSALQKIGGDEPQGDLRGGAAVSALCIVPTRSRRRLGLLSDHPPLEKRLRRLEEIAREMGRPAR